MLSTEALGGSLIHNVSPDDSRGLSKQTHGMHGVQKTFRMASLAVSAYEPMKQNTEPLIVLLLLSCVGEFFKNYANGKYKVAYLISAAEI